MNGASHPGNDAGLADGGLVMAAMVAACGKGCYGGQKCPIGGGINASVLDGWWAEGYRQDNGWAIGEETIGAAVEDQDRADAASLYRILEQEMVPLFFDKGPDGLRNRWIAMMKASIASVVPQFSAHRMVRDYVETIYLPAAARKGRGE